jgi:hypothetical protein
VFHQVDSTHISSSFFLIISSYVSIIFCNSCCTFHSEPLNQINSEASSGLYLANQDNPFEAACNILNSSLDKAPKVAHSDFTSIKFCNVFLLRKVCRFHNNHSFANVAQGLTEV